MKKIDWYILKKLLLTFAFTMLLFTVIAVAIDSSEKGDDFIKAKFNTKQIITEYYLGFVPFIWSLIFPLFVFIGVIFFTSKMASRSEIIAILASGTSYRRFLRSYIVGGVLLGSLLWVGSRYWIPKANGIRSNFQTRYVDNNNPAFNQNTGNCDRCYYLRTDSNTFVGIRDFDTSSKTSRGFFLDRIGNNKMIYNIRAEVIRWDMATKKWQLFNATERKIDSMGETMKHYDTMLIALNINPGELKKDKYLKDRLTTPELISLVKREELRGSEGLNTYRVEIYRRTATPVAVLILTLIGAAIASRKNRGGSGVHLAIGIVIAALYIVSDRFSTVFATKGNFPPLLAAWLPNIAFAIVAIRLYRKAPK